MESTIEIWKPIAGFEGLYEISSLGRVKNVPHWVTRDYIRNNGEHIIDRLFIKEKILNPKRKYPHSKRTKGGEQCYLGHALRKGGKYFNKLLHRLIAEAFIPNPDNKPCIDHINGDALDNRIENLRWCTYKENNNNPITKERKAVSSIGVNKGRKHTEEFKLMMSEKFKGRKIKKEWVQHSFKRVFQYTTSGEFVAE